MRGALGGGAGAEALGVVEEGVLGSGSAMTGVVVEVSLVRPGARWPTRREQTTGVSHCVELTRL